MSFDKKYILKQIHEVRTGGYSVLIKKLKRPVAFVYHRFVIRVLCAVPFFPAIIILRLVRPFLLIRLCRLHSLKIGHFSANTEMYLCKKHYESHCMRTRSVDIHFHANAIVCNSQLEIMWSRLIQIWPRWIMEPLFNANRLLPGGDQHELDVRSFSGRDENSWFDNSEPHLTFTPDEEALGLRSLENMGISAKDKFVCVIFRDHAYFDNLLGPGKDLRDGYRNASIQRFMRAAEELIQRGYFVLRMGKVVNDPFVSSSKNIIDYANSSYKSDFMDIYLGAKCTFAVSTGTGWDGVPQIFRRPICFVNFSPLGYFQTSHVQDLFIPKHHFSNDLQRELSLHEIFDCGAANFLHSSSYADINITLLENTSKELCDIVVEMDERIQNKSHEISVAGDELQNKFKTLFQEGIRACGISQVHNNVRANIGAEFLRQNGWWLE
jgi:putative glycosyltransferase (TIGR04372 family)